MTKSEDFYRDFLPRFIEAQRAFPVTRNPTWRCGPPKTP